MNKIKKDMNFIGFFLTMLFFVILLSIGLNACGPGYRCSSGPVDYDKRADLWKHPKDPVLSSGSIFAIDINEIGVPSIFNGLEGASKNAVEGLKPSIAKELLKQIRTPTSKNEKIVWERAHDNKIFTIFLPDDIVLTEDGMKLGQGEVDISKFDKRKDGLRVRMGLDGQIIVEQGFHADKSKEQKLTIQKGKLTPIERHRFMLEHVGNSGHLQLKIQTDGILDEKYEAILTSSDPGPIEIVTKIGTCSTKGTCVEYDPGKGIANVHQNGDGHTRLFVDDPFKYQGGIGLKSKIGGRALLETKGSQVEVSGRGRLVTKGLPFPGSPVTAYLDGKPYLVNPDYTHSKPEKKPLGRSFLLESGDRPTVGSPTGSCSELLMKLFGKC